jgi:antiviral helicase SKI2
VLRRPGPPEDFVKGSTRNHPFLPGGFDLSQTVEKSNKERKAESDGLRTLLEGGQLLTVPPGFSRGVTFDTCEV